MPSGLISNLFDLGGVLLENSFIKYSILGWDHSLFITSPSDLHQKNLNVRSSKLGSDEKKYVYTESILLKTDHPYSHPSLRLNQNRGISRSP